MVVIVGQKCKVLFTTIVFIPASSLGERLDVIRESIAMTAKKGS